MQNEGECGDEIGIQMRGNVKICNERKINNDEAGCARVADG